jgi:hypothetical protein
MNTWLKTRSILTVGLIVTSFALALTACKGKVTVDTPFGEGTFEGEGGAAQQIPADFVPEGPPCGQVEIGGKLYYIFCSGGRPIYMKPAEYEEGESPYLIPIRKVKPVEQPWQTSSIAHSGKVVVRKTGPSEFEFSFDGELWEFVPQTSLIPASYFQGTAEELIADWHIGALNSKSLELPFEFEVDDSTGKVLALIPFTTGVGLTQLPSPWDFGLEQETIVVVSADPHGKDFVMKAVAGDRHEVLAYFDALGSAVEIEGVSIPLD